MALSSAFSALALAPFAGCGTAYSSREYVTLTAGIDGIDVLVVHNAVGDITLVADPEAREVRAEIVKIGKGSSPQQADAALAQIEVHLEPAAGQAGAIEARATHPHGGAFRNYEVEWRVTAPPEFNLDVRTSVGEISATGFIAVATLKSNTGDITVSGGLAGLTAESGVGDIHAESAGVIDLRTDVGDAMLRVLPGDEGDIRARTQVGELTVELPADRRGHIKVASGVGFLRMQLESLNLGGGRVRHLEADLGGTSEPRIELSTDVGDLTVRTVPGGG